MGLPLGRFIRNPAPAAAGGGWTRRALNIERLYPDLTGNSLAIPGAAAWAFGAYVQLSAATAADYYPSVIHSMVVAQVIATGVNHALVEVEIATGASGLEVTYAQYSLGLAFNTTVANPLLVTGWTYPCGPTLIPSGTRIVYRVRISVAATMLGLEVCLYLGGHDAPPASDLTYALDPYLLGANTPHLLVTPVGSALAVPSTGYPNYAAWQQVFASAPFDLLVWGTSYALQAGLTSQGKHFQFGIGAAGSEVPYALIGLPSRFNTQAGVQWLRRPLLVRAGERLAVRASGGTRTTDHQIMYEEL